MILRYLEAIIFLYGYIGITFNRTGLVGPLKLILGIYLKAARCVIPTFEESRTPRLHGKGGGMKAKKGEVQFSNASLKKVVEQKKDKRFSQKKLCPLLYLKIYYNIYYYINILLYIYIYFIIVILY